MINDEENFKKLNLEKILDSQTKSTRRLEQSFLRKQKKRGLCSKLDYKNIVTPMCKFGCDDLYKKNILM